MDFRDENWATDIISYPSHDTYLNVDLVNNLFTLSHGSGQTITIYNGQTYQIWNIWSVTPQTSNFGTPVFVQNQYNNTDLGGTLIVASATISSGQWAVPPNQSTCLVGTNNERFNNVKHQNWNGNSVDYLLSRTITVPLSPFNQIAKFYDMQSATIEATLIDDGSNLDNIQFQDPWYVESNGTQPDIFHTFTSPYNPTGAYGQTSGGVFLGQSYGGASPYYSVQAPVTKSVGGYIAVFNDWAASPGGSVNFQDAASTTTPVVFNSSGATVTANYSRTTISTNVTLPAGTYNFIGTLTVRSGVTLTIGSGTTLNFPTGAGLVINGTLSSNGAVFTSTSGSWNGIILNSAEGSLIQNTTISYAASPIIINTTNNITITGCTINNSSFYGGDGNAAAAIQVWGSSPTISSTVIEGQSNSWSGIRFGSSSGGSLNNCTIENLGNGNGVIIQGGSSPTIFDNTIQNNHYHGIIINSNGSGSPTIKFNTLSSNGSSYVGLYFITSAGMFNENYISGSYYGVWCRYSSSPNTGGLGQLGANIITGNTGGVVATDNSYPDIGSALIPRSQYYGVCNQIYGNTTYDALAENSSSISAEFDWWGQYPPNTSKIYADGTSAVDYSNPETSSSDCPLNQGASPVYQASAISANAFSNDSLAYLMYKAMEAKNVGDYVGAALLCRGLLKDTASGHYRLQALVTLFNIFQSSGDSTIVNDLIKYSSLKSNLGITAKELLASAYAGEGKYEDAITTAHKLISAYPNSGTEMRALLTLASLSSFNHQYNALSSSALNALVQKYSTIIDSGLVVALGGFTNNFLPRASNKNSDHTVKSTSKDKLSFQLNSYPNPFNPSTIIHYEIPNDGLVTLKIYDELGREVKTLVNQYQNKGRYDINFDASNLASSIYFYRLNVINPLNQSQNYSTVKKMLLLK